MPSGFLLFLYYSRFFHKTAFRAIESIIHHIKIEAKKKKLKICIRPKQKIQTLWCMCIWVVKYEVKHSLWYTKRIKEYECYYFKYD